MLIGLRPNPTRASMYDHFNYTEKQKQSYIENAKRILVPVHGSISSLKALREQLACLIM
ncbi:MAG TPA: hypothetical protein VE378_03100 [Nitrososphaeraceae archaeon]|nr:hypothetical protein [Nitrososphaeraceae archaeon]